MAPPFVHEKALCESSHIGDGTRIWAFAHVLPNARIGRDCNICDGVFIENDVIVGDRVTVKCGVQLWDGVRLEDDVFIGPNATFTNDPFPRSRQPPAAFSTTHIRSGASIGANATILPGIEVGAGAMVGAGSVVTRSIPPNAVVTGNPATIVGYVGNVDVATEVTVIGAPEGPGAPLIQPTGVAGVELRRLARAEDLRGDIAVSEFERDLPFQPQRMFIIHSVPSRDVLGARAHLRLVQFMVCVRGSCRVQVDDGTARQSVLLDRPDIGLLVPPHVWCAQTNFTSDAALLVLCSERYDPSDYVRNYADFLRLVGEDKATASPDQVVTG
jgi:UDP-2-acetamido-3-amino-2,3-dideoxy-glucuronate N-acetyltransferase